MIKFLFPFLTLSTNWASIQAQNSYLSIKQGLHFPFRYSKTIPEANMLVNGNKKVTYLLDVGYNYKISRLISLRSGITYENRGWISYLLAYNPKTESLEDSVKSNFVYEFITIPIGVQVEFGNKFRGFLFCGLNSSYRIGGKIKTKNSDLVPLTNFHPEEKSPKWDFSINLGSGIILNLSDRVSLISEGSYYKGFTAIGNSKPIEREIFHKGLKFSIGLQYLLRKKALEAPHNDPFGQG